MTKWYNMMQVLEEYCFSCILLACWIFLKFFIQFNLFSRCTFYKQLSIKAGNIQPFFPYKDNWLFVKKCKSQRCEETRLWFKRTALRFPVVANQLDSCSETLHRIDMRIVNLLICLKKSNKLDMLNLKLFQSQTCQYNNKNRTNVTIDQNVNFVEILIFTSIVVVAWNVGNHVTVSVFVCWQNSSWIREQILKKLTGCKYGIYISFWHQIQDGLYS